MTNQFLRSKLTISIIVLALISTSCATKKDVVYFQNAKDFETIVDTDTFTPKFKINDIISINIAAYDIAAVKPFNLVSAGGSASSTAIDYLIDIDGNIDFPILGKIKLLGLTVEEAKQLLKKKLSNGYLKDPVVNIRVLNFRISVLGAVGSPGVYTVSGERINILEAIANAGDLDLKGRRDNILVIRDFNGTKTFTRIDITNKEIFNSPVYYLTQNDVVYVQPNSSLISGVGQDSRINQFISYFGFLTTVFLLITR